MICYSVQNWNAMLEKDIKYLYCQKAGCEIFSLQRIEEERLGKEECWQRFTLVKDNLILS